MMIHSRMEDVMKNTKRLFGMRMKELRKKQGLSQEELAEKINIWLQIYKQGGDGI